MVAASREEALMAIELYNRPRGHRSLEAYLVHMHIAWLYLLHAEFERDGTCYYYRDHKNHRRYLKVDGERKAWELSRCVSERWDSGHPVRQNLQLTIRLRNRIEHRYAEGLAVAAIGFLQSLLLNFEDEVVGQFGDGSSIAPEASLPISLNLFSRAGVARLAAEQFSLPRRLRDFFVEYRSALSSDVVEDRRFELRLDLVQKRAPKSEADLAVTFVNEQDLLPDELAAYQTLEKTGRVVIREKERPVANLGRLRPKAVCAAVEERIPYRFGHSCEFPLVWKKLAVRPPTSSRGKARKKTDERYCAYDEAHDDYVYTKAFVDLICEKCSTPEGFQDFVGKVPTIRMEVRPSSLVSDRS
jgi:hypothetical protein